MIIGDILGVEISLELVRGRLFRPIPEEGRKGVTCGIPVPRGVEAPQEEIQYCEGAPTHYTIIFRFLGLPLYLYVCSHHVTGLDLTTEEPKPKEPS